MTVSSLEYPSVLKTLKDNKFASGATPTNLVWSVSAKGNEATALGSSLITFTGNNPSHMGAMAKIVHRVVIRIGRRVWPVSISHEVIATKDLEARTDAATKLSRFKSVNGHKLSLDRSYGRMSVLDTAVYDRNSGPCPQYTVLMQLLYTSDAVD